MAVRKAAFHCLVIDASLGFGLHIHPLPLIRLSIHVYAWEYSQALHESWRAASAPVSQ
jgi:hypothetical protein